MSVVDRSVSAIILPLRCRCSPYLDAWRYNPACNEVVTWSIARICTKYEQRERDGTADREELNAGFQKRQEERYVIWLFLLLLGGGFSTYITGVLAIPPLHEKIGGCALNQLCALIWKNMVTTPYFTNVMRIMVP